LDPVVSDAVGRLAADDGFWQGLESESVWTLVRGLEPDSPYRYFPETRLDEAAEAFADFADLKSFYLAGHSRRVAALAERMASVLGSSPADLVTVRRAALLHDVGLVAVPSFVLHKPEDRLTDAEREALRLHPYHAERILARVPAFASAVPLVGASRAARRARVLPRAPL
jgi:HD-GYP domain-containing protein (c-di-GMP phosphodiesterase class II)